MARIVALEAYSDYDDERETNCKCSVATFVHTRVVFHLLKVFGSSDLIRIPEHKHSARAYLVGSHSRSDFREEFERKNGLADAEAKAEFCLANAGLTTRVTNLDAHPKDHPGSNRDEDNICRRLVLQECIGKLTVQQQLIIHLCLVVQMTTSEVALETGLTEVQVSYQLLSIRKFLRPMLQPLL